MCLRAGDMPESLAKMRAMDCALFIVALLKSFNLADDARADNPTSTGGGYDDIFLFAAVPALRRIVL